MTFDIPTFRTNFPEFKDTEKYPTSMIEFWGGLAQLQVRSCIWKSAWLQGVSLYVAHELVLATQNVKASGFGGSPGQQGGIANSKTVGQGTIAFDAQSSSEKNAGFWNLTTYGKQFYRLVRIFGAGAIQL
jgi:hypothetical protein